MRYYLFGVVLLLTAAGCSTSTSPTAPPQSIRGWVVRYGHATPIAGASVDLDGQKTITVDGEGYYEFTGVTVGDHALTATRTGYETLTKTAHVTANSIDTVLLQMHDSRANQGMLRLHVIDRKSGAPIKSALAHYTDLTGAQPYYSADNNGDITIYYTGPLGFLVTAKDYVDDSEFVNLQAGDTITDTVRLHKTIDDMLCLYRFSGNGIDSSDRGHYASINGATFVADRFGTPQSALKFSSRTDSVMILNSDELNFGKTGSFTICFWIQAPNALQGYDTYLVRKAPPANPLTGYYVSYNGYSMGLTMGTTYGTESVRISSTVGGAYWHFVALVVDRQGYMRSYLDGVQDGFDTPFFTGGAQEGNMDNSAPLVLCGSGTATAYFRGTLDDVRLYKAALSDEDVKTLYHEYGW